MKRSLLYLAASVLFAGSHAVAADPPPPPDPTVPDAALQRFLTTGKGQANTTPDIVLRGKILKADGSCLVLVEVNKRILILRKGVPVNLPESPARMTVQLNEVTRTSTVVQIMPSNQTLRLQ